MQVQGVTITDDGQATIKESVGVERHDRTPETCGRSLAEGKAVLQARQEVVVEGQMPTYLQQQRACPHGGKVRRSQDIPHAVFRTVFGALPVESPRLYHVRFCWDSEGAQGYHDCCGQTPRRGTRGRDREPGPAIVAGTP